MDAADAADIYEVVVERHRAAATVVTSNREPVEWLAMMADPPLAQSLLDDEYRQIQELLRTGRNPLHPHPARVTHSGPPDDDAAVMIALSRAARSAGDGWVPRQAG